MNKVLSLVIVVMLGGMLIAMAQSAPQQPAGNQPNATQPASPSGNPSQAQPASPSGSGSSADQQPAQPTQPTQPTQASTQQTTARRGVPWLWVAIGVAVLVIVLVALAGRSGSSVTTIVDRTERIDRDRDDIRRAS